MRAETIQRYDEAEAQDTNVVVCDETGNRCQRALSFHCSATYSPAVLSLWYLHVNSYKCNRKNSHITWLLVVLTLVRLLLTHS